MSSLHLTDSCHWDLEERKRAEYYLAPLSSPGEKGYHHVVKLPRVQQLKRESWRYEARCVLETMVGMDTLESVFEKGESLPQALVILPNGFHGSQILNPLMSDLPAGLFDPSQSNLQYKIRAVKLRTPEGLDEIIINTDDLMCIQSLFENEKQEENMEELFGNKSKREVTAIYYELSEMDKS